MKRPSRIIGVHFDADYERHKTGLGHPESAGRYSTLRHALEQLPPEIVRLPCGRRAKVGEILLAHDANYHDLVYRDTEAFADHLSAGDTTICEASYDVAVKACGAVLDAVDAVMAGKVDGAFCAVRPPGHHATTDRGMGFCIFNHVAVAARYLQRHYGISRVAIIDWDVHHGNGTEDIFIQNPSVFYVSLHEENIYPYTASASNRGKGEGKGFNLNIPLPHGSDGAAALAAWDTRITPALEEFRPGFVLISAGFDAGEGDPIGGLNWSDDTFVSLTRRCMALADRCCRGRLISVLEGGYNPSGLASAAIAHVLAMNNDSDNG